MPQAALCHWRAGTTGLTQLRARLLLAARHPEARSARSEAEALLRQLIERARRGRLAGAPAATRP